MSSREASVACASHTGIPAREASAGKQPFFLLRKRGRRPLSPLHAERAQDVARVRTQTGALLDEFVASGALRRTCIVRECKHLPSVGERAVRRDERSALFPCRQHERSLRKPRENAVARMERILLHAHAEGKFADEQRPSRNFALKRRVRGGIIDVQPAGKHADEIAPGQRAVNGGAVAPFRDPRDNDEGTGQLRGDRLPRLRRPRGQDAGSDDTELPPLQQLSPSCAKERERRIGDRAQRFGIVRVGKRDGKAAPLRKAGKTGVRLPFDCRAVIFIYTVCARLYHRGANFFKLFFRKPVRAQPRDTGAGAFVRLRTGGKPDERAVFLGVAAHSRLSPSR